MQAAKSVRVLISRSTQSHAKSAASKTGHVTIAPATTVHVMIVLLLIVPMLTVHVMTVHATTVLGAIVHKVTAHALMKRGAKHLAIAMAKASAITPHAKALPHAEKPALKAAPMIASRRSQ
jgi:hypothetical protein